MQKRRQAATSSSSSESTNKETKEVRWMYTVTVDNDLWSLELGDSKDELKSVLVGSLPHGDRPNSDPWGLSMIWAKERFEFAPGSAHACVNKLPVSSAWSKGIRVDTKLCQECMGHEAAVCGLVN